MDTVDYIVLAAMISFLVWLFYPDGSAKENKEEAEERRRRAEECERESREYERKIQTAHTFEQIYELYDNCHDFLDDCPPAIKKRLRKAISEFVESGYHENHTSDPKNLNQLIRLIAADSIREFEWRVNSQLYLDYMGNVAYDISSGFSTETIHPDWWEFLDDDY